MTSCSLVRDDYLLPDQVGVCPIYHALRHYSDASANLAFMRQHWLWQEYGLMSGVYCLTDAKGEARYALLCNPDDYELDNKVLT